MGDGTPRPGPAGLSRAGASQQPGRIVRFMIDRRSSVGWNGRCSDAPARPNQVFAPWWGCFVSVILTLETEPPLSGLNPFPETDSKHFLGIMFGHQRSVLERALGVDLSALLYCASDTSEGADQMEIPNNTMVLPGCKEWRRRESSTPSPDYAETPSLTSTCVNRPCATLTRKPCLSDATSYAVLTHPDSHQIDPRLTLAAPRSPQSQPGGKNQAHAPLFGGSTPRSAIRFRPPGAFRNQSPD